MCRVHSLYKTDTSETTPGIPHTGLPSVSVASIPPLSDCLIDQNGHQRRFPWRSWGYLARMQPSSQTLVPPKLPLSPQWHRPRTPMRSEDRNCGNSTILPNPVGPGAWKEHPAQWKEFPRSSTHLETLSSEDWPVTRRAPGSTGRFCFEHCDRWTLCLCLGFCLQLEEMSLALPQFCLENQFLFVRFGNHCLCPNKADKRWHCTKIAKKSRAPTREQQNSANSSLQLKKCHWQKENDAVRSQSDMDAETFDKIVKNKHEHENEAAGAKKNKKLMVESQLKMWRKKAH